MIENLTDASLEVTLTTFGVPEVAPDAGDYGCKITHRYFTLGGVEVSEPLNAGTRLVAVLEVTPFEDLAARLILDDPLPGGFEIDNPTLIRSGDVGALNWLETAELAHVAFRSDRFIAAVDPRTATPFRLAYTLRAVTPGRYHHGAATVEDMYRPAFRAHTGSGRVEVTP
ncbi:MAG: hypothetical protein AAF943_00815 [Pseudomonadota bacterium]